MHASTDLHSWAGNIFSAAAIVGTFMGWLPALAAGVGMCWYLIKIYESVTVQRWVAARRARKIARLKARVLLMEAQNLPPLPGPFDEDAPKRH